MRLLVVGDLAAIVGQLLCDNPASSADEATVPNRGGSGGRETRTIRRRQEKLCDKAEGGAAGPAAAEATDKVSEPGGVRERLHYASSMRVNADRALLRFRGSHYIRTIRQLQLNVSIPLISSPVPNFDLKAAAAAVLADVVPVDGSDERQLASLKELYIGFSEQVKASHTA